MSKFSRFLCICLIISGLLWFEFPLFLKSAALFLIVEKPPLSPCVGIVLSGNSLERLNKAAQLFQQQQVAPLILTGGQIYNVSVPQLMADYLHHNFGISYESFIYENHAKSTYENAVYAKSLIEKNGLLDTGNPHNILIITSNYHTRRTYFIFQKVFRDTPATLFIVGADDSIDYSHWWQSHESASSILMEWCKLIWYWMAFR